MEKLELSTIFDLIKNNEEIGLELIYKNYYRYIYSVAYSVLNNEEDVKEIIQIILIKLNSLAKDKFPSKGYSSWFYTLIKNEALMYKRSLKETITIDEFNFTYENKELKDLIDLEAYYSLIKNLNATQQEVVTLKIVGEMSHKEIAHALNKPIGTIQWIYNTSIKQLKLILSTLSAFIVMTGLNIIYELQKQVNTKVVPELYYSSDVVVSTNNIEFNSINISIVLLIVFITSFIFIYIKGANFKFK